VNANVELLTNYTCILLNVEGKSFSSVYCTNVSVHLLLHSSVLEMPPCGTDTPSKVPFQCRSGATSIIWFLEPTRVFIPNGILISLALCAQLIVECPYTLRMVTTFSPKIVPSPWRTGTPINTVLCGLPSEHHKRHLDRFSCFCRAH